MALLSGKVDAIYTLSKHSSTFRRTTGKIKAIEDLSKYPDWTLQVANTPAVITCTDVMAEEHPELVVTYMKAMIKVGRWANQYKQAAAVILDRQTFYRDAEDTYQGIKHVDMVPNLSPQNLACVEIGKNFMLSHGYIKNDFDVHEWAAPEFLEQAARELLEEEWKKRSTAKLPETSERRRLDDGWLGIDGCVVWPRLRSGTRGGCGTTAIGNARPGGMIMATQATCLETGLRCPKRTRPLGAVCDAPGGVCDVEGRSRGGPHPRRSHL